MDVFKDPGECKRHNVVWDKFEAFKKNYDVITSWGEIEASILGGYEPPVKKVTPTIQENSDPKHLYRKLIDDLNPGFYKQTKQALHNALLYCYERFGTFYYVKIRDGKLARFAYIWDQNYENPLSEHLKIDPKWAARYRNSNKKKWIVLGSMIRVYEKKYEGYAMDFYYNESKYMLTQICSSCEISDCDFLILHKDKLSIKKNLSEPAEEVVGSTTYPLPKKYIKSEYCPIISYGWNERYADIPLPTPNDIVRMWEVYVAPYCLTHYGPIKEIPWKSKKPTAVFRGSFTGSSATVDGNPRLGVSMLSWKWARDPELKTYLDAGLTGSRGMGRGRKELNDPYIRFLDKKLLNYMLVEPLNHQQQVEYKYAIYIEGNVNAYRGAYMFSWGSVVLWVKSHKYYNWFEPYLEDGVNCIIIDNKLTNLEEKIRWLRAHDAEAEKIAQNGKILYETLLKKNACIDYIQYTINKICAS